MYFSSIRIIENCNKELSLSDVITLALTAAEEAKSERMGGRSNKRWCTRTAQRLGAKKDSACLCQL